MDTEDQAIARLQDRCAGGVVVNGKASHTIASTDGESKGSKRSENTRS